MEQEIVEDIVMAIKPRYRRADERRRRGGRGCRGDSG